MSYNKKALRVDLGKYYKPNPYKKDIITDPAGQWKYPGQLTRIPGNQITMQGVPYPVYGQDDQGNGQMMYPGQEYVFPGNYVDEIPMAQKGLSVNSIVNTPRSLAYNNKKITKGITTLPEIPIHPPKDEDSNAENLWEIVDPTGYSSWDDIAKAYKKSGVSWETALEVLGAIPFLGKIGKSGKVIAGGFGLLQDAIKASKYLPAKEQKAFIDAAYKGYQKYAKTGGKELDKVLGKSTEIIKNNVPFLNPEKWESSSKAINAANKAFKIGKATDAYQAYDQWNPIQLDEGFAQGGAIPELPLNTGRKAYHAWGYTNNDFIVNRQEGGYIETELSPEEIQQYRDGGYIVEDISVPQLTKAQTGMEQEVYTNQDAPEVPIVAQAPDWLKFAREYESVKSKDTFVEEKKKKYLKQNKGLNKLAGLSMDNFPKEVEKNFADEYDYKKNTYVTRKLGKKEGFNPRHRGNWVDELTPGEQQVVANSKYGSKLQPGAWSRTLAGAQELGNAIVKQLPGKQGDVFKYNIPGLTKREQKEIAESPTGALELFSGLDAPTGYNVINFLKNRGLSTGSNYKELPGLLSGELMPNATADEAMAFNPFNYYGVESIPGAVGKGLVKTGRAADKLALSATKKLFPGAKSVLPDVAQTSFDLTRPDRVRKIKKPSYYEEIKDGDFTIIKEKGTAEQPKNIIVKKDGKHIHAELKKDGTWLFHNTWHDLENPARGRLEAGRAMKLMNKHITPFPTIYETQSFSPDSYKNLLNLTKHPDWDYTLAGRIPLNNQGKVSDIAKNVMSDSHASTRVIGKENAQKIVDEMNSMLVKRGFDNPLHHKAFFRGLIDDEYEVFLPNFKLKRKYGEGGSIDLELSPDEIKAYQDQGYTIEYLD